MRRAGVLLESGSQVLFGSEGMEAVKGGGDKGDEADVAESVYFRQEETIYLSWLSTPRYRRPDGSKLGNFGYEDVYIQQCDGLPFTC